MTYQELVSKLKDTYQEKDASKISEHLAIQFNIQGEAKVPCIWKLQTDSFMLNHMNITTVTF